jgi:hypothetical protein
VFTNAFREPAKVGKQAVVGLRQILMMLHLGICDKEDFPRRTHLTARPKEYRLIGLLERSRHARSTDPRDEVFAFLNLCREEERRSLCPDYMETVAETYARVARVLINRGEAPRLLCNAFLSDSTLQLPSWIPDWSLNNLPLENIAPDINPRTDTEEEWPCAGGNKGEFALNETCDVLQALAYKIDQISYLGPIYKFRENPSITPFDDEHELANTIERILRCRNTPAVNQFTSRESTNSKSPDEAIKELLSPARSEEAANTQRTEDELLQSPVLWSYLSEITTHVTNSTAYSNEDKKEIIWRTMICEREIGTSHRAPPEYYGDWKTYCEVVKMLYLPGSFKQRLKQISWPPHGNQESGTKAQCPKYTEETAPSDASLILDAYERFQRAAHRLCFQLRAGMSSTGLVDMVPHRTEIGDFIVIIKGVCVPFVLRRVDGFDDRFQVVGQAYFYGFMNGEVLQRSALEFDTIFLA